jgi:asparagine synthase (glutamine-hydrolysing)
MCGICGIINLNGRLADLSNPLVKMTIALRHRGPNDEGYLLVSGEKANIFKGDDTKLQPGIDHIRYYPTDPVQMASDHKYQMGFGFRRLSILDLSIRGHQPMSYMDRYWIVFNGEIYNYIELREELKKDNYIFHTNTDTEVILASYDKWGKECLQRFNGMWAFVIFDQKENKLFISRDRFGIKPLVYYIDDEKLIFASEIKALLKSGYITTTPNLSYLDILLKDDAREYDPETSFKDIYNFPQGSFLEIPLSKMKKENFVPSKYYILQYIDKDETFSQKKAENLAVNYLDLLEDSVKLRMRADVPIGTCLSGGLDSTSVVYFINKLLKEPQLKNRQKTFSLIFNEDSRTQYTDESQYIVDLAKMLNLNSFTISPTASEVKEMYTKMIYAMDNPQVSSLMSYMFTYKLVKENSVIITLDGQGADEYQAGYTNYLINLFANLGYKEIISNKAFYTSNHFTRKDALVGIVFKIQKSLRLQGLVSEFLLLSGRKTDPFIGVNERLYNDINGNLVNLFHYGDRASMAFSIESRFPMMDYRLVEFWMQIPASFKLHNGYSKYIARMAMHEKLPTSINWRKDKMGWEIPQGVWFREDLKSWFTSNILNSSFITDFLKIPKNQLETMLFRKKISYFGLKYLIKLHNIALWHRLFFENNNP